MHRRYLLYGLRPKVLQGKSPFYAADSVLDQSSLLKPSWVALLSEVLFMLDGVSAASGGREIGDERQISVYFYE